MSSIHAAWQAAQQRLPAIRVAAEGISQPSAATVQRIGQIDSEQLDHDLVQLLKEPVAKALNLLNVRSLAFEALTDSYLASLSHLSASNWTQSWSLSFAPSSTSLQFGTPVRPMVHVYRDCVIEGHCTRLMCR